jgi:putative ABC transport system permease protein
MDKFLERFCAPHLLEEVQGDLHETYQQRIKQVGITNARREYLRWVLQYFLNPYFYSTVTQPYPNPLFTAMLRNYLTIAWRNLWKARTFSLITIGGLSTGLACITVILLFVDREFAFDRFHREPGQVYRVVSDFVNDDGTKVPGATTPPALAPVLQHDLPEVAHVTRLYPEPGNMVMVEYDTKRFYETDLIRVDSNFFDVFNFPLQRGDAASALQNPHSILLTQTLAEKYFGDVDPIGKVMKIDIDGGRAYTVTGVLKDVPETSHFTFNILVPLHFNVDFISDINKLWYWYNYYTYLRLKPGTAPAAFTAKLQPLVNQHVPGNKNQFYSQALTDIHLHSALNLELATNGDVTYVRILILIAVLVIVLAGINYINLITAQSAKRAKEIGIRKVAGAFRNSVTRQFLMESVLTALLAFGVAMVAVIALLPALRELMGAGLSVFAPESNWLWPLLLVVVLAVGLLAGLYPALYLSAFEPVQVLKGSFVSSRRGIFLRKGLVVFQFVISISLLTGALIIDRQMTFMREKKIGFEQENIVIVPNAGGLQNLQALTNEWEKKPDVVEVGEATGVFGGGNWTIVVKTKDKADKLLLNFLVVDYDFLTVMGVTFKEGRNFSREFGTDVKAGVILNEAAVKQLGLKEPVVGKQIEWNVGGDKDNFKQVIGVVEDFHFTSFREAIKPFGFVAYTPNPGTPNPGTLFVKVRSGDLTRTVARLQTSWEKFVPERPFAYSFQDEQMARLHQSEARFQRLFSSLTVLAIVIACLGLLGLAIYTAEQRTKEIGVRKILGADITSIVVLLSREFVGPVIVAFLLAIPLTWYAMNKWLQGFAYRIDISWWMFLVAGLLAILIALVTISYQSIKAAVNNPIKSLRSE